MKCGGVSSRKPDLLDYPPELPQRKPKDRRADSPLLENPPTPRKTPPVTFRRRAQSINTKDSATSALFPIGDSKASRMKMKEHLSRRNKGGVTIEIEDMIARAGDLDVIMVATTDRTMSSLIRLATWSEYDHVLFMRRSRRTGRLSVVEAVESGVVSYGITEFIKDWSEGRYFRVAYRKLLGNIRDRSRKALEDFCVSHIGSPFGISGFFFANDFNVSPPSSPGSLPSRKPPKTSFSTREITTKSPDDEESNQRRKKQTRRRRKDHSAGRKPWETRRAFFCSELVAAAYRSAGVLKKECSEGSFTPGSFASKSCPWLAENFQMGPVMRIVMKRMEPIGFWPEKAKKYSSHSEPQQSSIFRSKTRPLSSDRAKSTNVASLSSSPPISHAPVLGTPPTPSTPRSNKTGKGTHNVEGDAKEKVAKLGPSRDYRPPLLADCRSGTAPLVSPVPLETPLMSPVPPATKLTSPKPSATAEDNAPKNRKSTEEKRWWKEAQGRNPTVKVANVELRIKFEGEDKRRKHR